MGRTCPRSTIAVSRVTKTYVESLWQFYKKCDIYGILYSAMQQQYSRIIACIQDFLCKTNSMQSQHQVDNQNTAISIQNCCIIAASDLGDATSNYNGIQTYLGRPWKEYACSLSWMA